VGASLTRRLLELGHPVELLVRPGYQPWRIADIAGEVRIHVVDLLDAEGLRAALARARPGWVFHLAAHGAYSWERDVEKIVSTNLLGLTILLEACARAGVAAFVNTGSSSEYGLQDHAPHEDELPAPNSHYAVTKLAATMWCRHVARATGAHIPTLRLYSVHGAWEEPRRLIASLVVHGLRGRLPSLADPDVARDFVHVDDVAAAYVAAARVRPGEAGAVYNIGSGVQTTLREAVEAARRVFGIAEAPRWGTMPRRDWDGSVWVANPGKADRELGWRAAIALEDGMARTGAWLAGRPDLRQRYEAALLT
jgi:nucleoside-diphosphate-sugar epimerase